MSESVVLGSGPITLTAHDGRLLLIPLSALTFADGKIQATNWPLYNTYQAYIDPWLGYLVSIGALTPGATPPPKPAMLIQATDLGAAGNNIQVVFSNIVVPDPSDPTKTTFDATITEIDTYPGLSIDPALPSFIGDVLGTETATGTRPGLVHILNADIPAPPAPPAQLALPLAHTYPLGGGAASKKSSAAVNNFDSSGNSFHVEAKKPGKDGDNTIVTVSNVDPTNNTFTLVATWTQPTITGIKLTDLPGKLAGSGYEIKVSKHNGDFAIPAPGPVGLSGGADAKTASNASGIALAS